MGRPRDLGKRRFWGAQLRAWQQSGLTQADYCRRQGLDRRRFHFWKDLLERERSPEPMPAAAPVLPPVRFVPVPVGPLTPMSAASGGSPRATLTLVTGAYRIEISDEFRTDTLVRLLTTLERR